MTAVRLTDFSVLTFDCYGTLIDWEGGIATAFERAARAAGVRVDRRAVLAAYHQVEPAVQGEAYRRYRDVLGETARRVAGRLGWTLDPAGAGFLADSLADWPPFPDTDPALARLAGAGYRLGILSNVDDDLLAATRRHFTVTFEFCVTAQQVGAYKPARPHFARGRELVGGRRWLHAAQSWFHDVAPARALGIPVAWINRKGERAGEGGPPDREFRTLGELADWLVPAR
ncbi:MAG: haloacid dehalogenase [Candidatus Rokubacteria bacterium]|nr:haloacid dehalogenase [Candidatus Rokubacteria bacterium]